ncbi:MAG TPA: hypothetical protein VE395_12735 [Acidimicrobiales bacterium]|nr:hypothetical protein [Acidimicrobiales bacterium]
MNGNPVAFVLHLVGYPTAVVVIARWIPVVRQRRLKWFVAHEAAVAAIVTGWAIVGRRQGVVVNGAWGLIAAAWYALGGRRTR